ncbi:MAG: hypothetical protein ACE5GZ_07140 [Gammaproteobacteria bacterium]
MNSKKRLQSVNDPSDLEVPPDINVPPQAYQAVMQNSSGDVTKEKMDRFFRTFPEQQKVASHIPELAKYRFIARITEACCYFGVDVGDEYVFSDLGLLDPERTTGPLCPWIIGRMSELMIMYWDRICADADPNECFWTTGECPDRGMEHGGFGKVKFKFRAELKPKEEWHLNVGRFPVSAALAASEPEQNELKGNPRGTLDMLKRDK